MCRRVGGFDFKDYRLRIVVEPSVDVEYSEWHGSNHAIVGETYLNNDVYFGSAKRGRLQRHSASGGDGECQTKCGSRPGVGLCESIDEHVDNERDLVAKSSGGNVGTVGHYASGSDDFGQQCIRHDGCRDVSVYLYHSGGL